MVLSMYVPVNVHKCMYSERVPRRFLYVFVLTVCVSANSQHVCVISLQEIANHMEKDTETYEVVQEAIDTMQRVAWHINDMKRKHEHAVRLQV